MNDLTAKDKNFVWHPFTQHQTDSDPIPIVRALESLLFTEEGNSYLDVNSSWWVNVHGHGHPHIGQAIEAQFKSLDHVIFAGVTHPKAVELSERILALLPESLSKVFFSDNGSTAVEVALKMAFQYWFNRGEDRKQVLALDGAYHGDTFGAMSVGQRDLFNKPFEPFFFDVTYLPFPTSENEEAVLQQAKECFESGKVASLIVEPLIQGAAGMRIYSAEFLDRLVVLAKEFDVLVIFDEVMTGFGRTGKMFALDYCNETPDLVTFSKGLTAGVLPMGLTVATEKLFQSFLSDEKARGFLHGHSFTGNPLACAAACASLDLFEQRETWEHVERLENWNEAFALNLNRHPLVRNCEYLGTILRFEIALEPSSSYFSNLRNIAYEFFLEKGILLRPLGNVVFINPPYCFTEEEFEKVSFAILELLGKL